MNTAAYYAKALWEVRTSDVLRTSDVQLLKNLRAALARRGHEKLLPRIWSEFQKLDVQKKRTEKHRETTPEMEQTDTLLQLYHRLIATK